MDNSKISACPRDSGIDKYFSWIIIAVSIGYIAAFWFDWTYMQHFYSAPEEFDRAGSGDAGRYLKFKELATAAYPLFLRAVTSVFGTLEAVPKVQLVLSTAAVSFLAWSVRKTFGAPCLALTLVLVLFAEGALTRFDALIQTEALFVALLCAMLGALIRLLATPTAGWAAFTASLCGLAIAVRPAGLSLLTIWPVVLWFLWNRYDGSRLRFVAAIAVPLTVCSLAESAIWHGSRDGSRGRPNLGNVHMFAKMLMMDAEPAFSEEHLRNERLMNLVAEARREMEPLRAAAAAAPGWRSRAILLEQFEVVGQQLTYRLGFRQLANQLANSASGPGREVHGNHLLGEVSWPTLLAAPSYWTANAWLHYWALWANYRIYDRNFAARHMAYVGSLEDGGLLRESQVTLPLRPKLKWAVSANRVLALASFLVSLTAIGLAAWRRLSPTDGRLDNALAAAAIAALLVHGYYLLTSLFGVAQMRYATTMWPFQTLCGFLFAHWALRRIEARFRDSPRGI